MAQVSGFSGAQHQFANIRGFCFTEPVNARTAARPKALSQCPVRVAAPADAAKTGRPQRVTGWPLPADCSNLVRTGTRGFPPPPHAGAPWGEDSQVHARTGPYRGLPLGGHPQAAAEGRGSRQGGILPRREAPPVCTSAAPAEATALASEIGAVPLPAAARRGAPAPTAPGRAPAAVRLGFGGR